MRRILPIAFGTMLLTACSSPTHSTSPPATKAPVTTKTVKTKTPSPTPARTVQNPGRTPTVVASINFRGTAEYRSFVNGLCKALGSHDAGTVQGDLMNYEYNSGVRYGNLGDGEGQSADPSILNTWLGSAVVTCRYYTPDVAGHGTLLTSGWNLSGGWGLIEMDHLNGSWKINDFTFGTSSALYYAMQTSHPILTYHA